jgi:hypothetical protein
LGRGKDVVDVQGSSVQVNMDQPAVSGVLSEVHVENLLVNGRNFLDLAN